MIRSFCQQPRLLTLFMVMIAVFTSPVTRSDNNVVRLSKPVQVTDDYEVFGAPMTSAGEALSLEALLDNAREHLHQKVTVTTRVAQVCQKKGCFFIAQQGAHSARVSFKDYGFFVPSNISGRTVTLVGELFEREVSPQQAQHFSEDAGKSGMIQPGKQLEIVATSVRVPRLARLLASHCHRHVGVAFNKGGESPFRFGQHFDALESLQNLLPQYSELQFGESITHAAVNAEPERQVLPRVGPLNVEHVGIFKHVRVTVAGHHRRAGLVI